MGYCFVSANSIQSVYSQQAASSCVASMQQPLSWTITQYQNLTKCELYAILQLRVDVFVVEQKCAYSEIDGQDNLDSTMHYLGLLGSQLCCYARTLAPAEGSDAMRIGRVVVTREHRGKGLAKQLLTKMISDIAASNPQQAIALSAQTDALGLYKQLGFVESSKEYLDDGIPHIDMLFLPD